MPEIDWNWLNRFGVHARDLLFPPTCIGCHRDLERDEPTSEFCLACWEQLPILSRAVCQKCAAPVPEIPGEVQDCIRCRENKLQFDRTYALGTYEGLLRDLLLEMKRDRRELIAAALARTMAKQFTGPLKENPPSGLIAIPMPWARRFRRGTNPASALAECLSRELKIPLFRNFLRKSSTSDPQLGLSRAGRFRNIRGQISIHENSYAPMAHVLVVDDIMTTGATCNEAAKVLKRSGIQEVTVMVVARTPEA